MSSKTQNLVPTRELSVIEQHLVEDVAEQCQEAGHDELTSALIVGLRPVMAATNPTFWEQFAPPDEVTTAVEDLLKKAIAAGYVWGTRTGYSAGYTAGVAMMKNSKYSKDEAVSQFYAALHDPQFINDCLGDDADEALLRFYRPTRLEVNA